VSDGPRLRVVSGSPTAEELAVLAAVVAVAAAAGPPETPPAPPHGRWSDPVWSVRHPITPGPGAWRAAAFRG
jgi:hypothetical protein